MRQRDVNFRVDHVFLRLPLDGFARRTRRCRLLWPGFARLLATVATLAILASFPMLALATLAWFVRVAPIAHLAVLAAGRTCAFACILNTGACRFLAVSIGPSFVASRWLSIAATVGAGPAVPRARAMERRTDVARRSVQRGDVPGDFDVTPLEQLEIYREALLIFCTKVCVYLRAWGRELPPRAEHWIE